MLFVPAPLFLRDTNALQYLQTNDLPQKSGTIFHRQKREKSVLELSFIGGIPHFRDIADDSKLRPVDSKPATELYELQTVHCSVERSIYIPFWPSSLAYQLSCSAVCCRNRKLRNARYEVTQQGAQGKTEKRDCCGEALERCNV